MKGETEMTATSASTAQINERTAQRVADLNISSVVADKIACICGCFWSIEKAFDDKPGVISAVSGFMGGKTKNPTYAQVVGGSTGHLESVQVTYDPAKISYEKLLDIFWHDIDPTDPAVHFAVPQSSVSAETASSAIPAVRNAQPFMTTGSSLPPRSLIATLPAAAPTRSR